jgi:hypothetical protein
MSLMATFDSLYEVLRLAALRRGDDSGGLGLEFTEIYELREHGIYMREFPASSDERWAATGGKAGALGAQLLLKLPCTVAELLEFDGGDGVIRDVLIAVEWVDDEDGGGWKSDEGAEALAVLAERCRMHPGPGPLAALDLGRAFVAACLSHKNPSQPYESDEVRNDRWLARAEQLTGQRLGFNGIAKDGPFRGMAARLLADDIAVGRREFSVATINRGLNEAAQRRGQRRNRDPHLPKRSAGHWDGLN